jgi:hypothetical protein
MRVDDAAGGSWTSSTRSVNLTVQSNGFASAVAADLLSALVKSR